jgi:hypothetical protein
MFKHAPIIFLPIPADQIKMQNHNEEELNNIREQLFGHVQDGAKKVLRIFFAIVLCLSITPYLVGGGWAVVNIGVLSYFSNKDPELLRTMQRMKIESKNNPGLIKQFKNHPLVIESYARTRTIVGLLIPLLIGVVFGLICRQWIFALIPFGISIAMNMSPLLHTDLWLVNTWIGLGLAVMLLLLSSWFFSRIRFAS